MYECALSSTSEMKNYAQFFSTKLHKTFPEFQMFLIVIGGKKLNIFQTQRNSPNSKISDVD